MDVLKAVQNYIDKIVTKVSGMKVLLLDSETVGYRGLRCLSGGTYTVDARPPFSMFCVLRLANIDVTNLQTPIISNVITQSALLSHETYLIDRIDNRNRDRMRHLKCICFLRPTQQIIQTIVEELREPCYKEYYLCKQVL
jgi:hypothetical protein